MDHLFGLPAHPLIVHIPVVLLPLATVGVAVMLVRRSWYERYKWAVLAIATVGTIGAFVATSSGEELESAIRRKDGADAARAVHEHAQAGETARTFAILFLIALAAWVVVPLAVDRLRGSRPTRRDDGVTDGVTDGDTSASSEATPTWQRWIHPVLMVAVAVTAVASTWAVIDAGHTGASRAWDEYNEASPRS